MILSPPEISEIGDEIQISVEVKFEKKQKFPKKLWFRFPKQYQPMMSIDSDPFLVGLILLAMNLKESIHVQGSVSKRVFSGLKEYQKIYQQWFPDLFETIEISCDHLRDDAPPKNRTQACAFSGGVDSFFTLIQLRENLTHVLFMAGFDMPLNLSKSIQDLTSKYAVLIKKFGIQWISGSTNIRNFVNRVDWTNAHGQALAASALFFKESWNQFYIPSSYTLKSYPKWGTHPQLDFLLSSETMEFIHHGAESNRVNKLERIVQVPESYEHLRVCWIQDLGLKNCANCEKCIRTMIALKILKSLHLYTTFGENPLTRAKIRNLKMRTYQSRLFALELMKEAAARRQFLVFWDLGYALLKRTIFYRFVLKT